MDKILTTHREYVRVKAPMSGLSELLHKKLAGRPVAEGARICKMPDSRFRDMFYGRSQRPHPDHLRPLMALGLEWEDLVLAVYGGNTAAPVTT